jgi:hypothetical protein
VPSDGDPTGLADPLEGSGEATATNATDVATGQAAPSAPPLRIVHILLFTATTAGYLMALRHWLRLAGPESDPAEMTIGLLAAEAVCVGPALGTVYLWRGWRERGYRFPLHGGEWLLVIFAGFALVTTLARVILASPNQLYVGTNALPAFGVLFGLLALGGLMVYLACSPHRLPPRWRVFFGVKTLALTSAVFLSEGDIGWLVVSSSEWAALWIVTVADGGVSQRYPWTHWLGIAICLGDGAIGLIQHLA